MATHTYYKYILLPTSKQNTSLFDYVKILLKNPNISYIKNRPSLDFKLLVSEKNGDCSGKTVAYYHYCKITIYSSGLVYFKGSIHKMWNSLNNVLAPNYNPTNYKGFNGNQYTLQDLLNTRRHLCELLCCEPQQMVFQNIEFGLNINTLFDPQLFITGLLYHHGKVFETGHNRKYREVRHSIYRVKIYNKGKQCGMDKNVLRVEVACKKSEAFESTGIETFADVNSETLKKGLKLILKRLDEVVYYDKTICTKTLTKREKTSLLNYSNINYWFDTLKPNKRDSPKKKLQEFINQYSQNLHAQIRSKLLQSGVIKDRLSENQSRVIKDTLYIGVNITQNTTQNTPLYNLTKPNIKNEIGTSVKNRKCLITGMDISMQKRDSILLSHTGLKYLLNEDYQNYLIIKNKYLSVKWIGVNLETEIKEIAHNIRNKKSNYLRTHQFSNNQPTLF
ncbi:hypothetical protein ACXGQW_05540 [Wenyingzhuangia sp. IMCC45533]